MQLKNFVSFKFFTKIHPFFKKKNFEMIENELTPENTPLLDLKNRKPIKLRSWVWNYCEKVDKDTIKCNVCNEKFQSYNSSTTEPIQHLLKHDITAKSINSYNKNYQAAKRMRLEFEDNTSDEETNADSNQNYSASQAKVQNLHEILMDFIISDNLPLKIVESIKFQKLLDGVKSGYYKLPSRKTIGRTMLPNMVI